MQFITIYYIFKKREIKYGTTHLLYVIYLKNSFKLFNQNIKAKISKQFTYLCRRLTIIHDIQRFRTY